VQNINKKTILIGYSGHGIEVADAAIQLGYNLIGYCDLNKKKTNPFNLNFLGNEKELKSIYFNDEYQFIMGIGDNKIRNNVFDFLINKTERIISIIHRKAVLSSKVNIKKGSYISKNSLINSMSEIGSNCIINSGSIIEHDCKILNNVHVAPGCVVLGNVKIGSNSFIGANSTIKEGLEIGNNVIIGAGSLVLNDIPNDSLFYGSPGKIIK